MRKSTFIFSAVSAAVLAASFSTQAATNAQMTITGDVVAVTCDVSVSTSNLDLGNHKQTDFTAVATPVAASVKPFTVGLNNCDTPAAGKIAGVTLRGQTLGGNPNIFNSTGTNTGVMVKLASTSGFISNGDTVDIATADATTPAVGDFNGKTISLEAGLAKSSATADFGHINAPVLFSFAYR